MHCKKGNKKISETKPWPVGVQFHILHILYFNHRHEWNHGTRQGPVSREKWQLPEPKHTTVRKSGLLIHHSILSDLTIDVNAKE
jgi:hypothetical protein